jgi:hypothetical protein
MTYKHQNSRKSKFATDPPEKLYHAEEDQRRAARRGAGTDEADIPHDWCHV